jgi:DNA-directed RNA polymerase subunit RPC12/RpoP
MDDEMPDLNFDCPECGQNLDAPDDMAGMEIECPNCAKRIAIPGGTPDPDPADDTNAEGGEEMKKSTTMRLEIPKDVGVPAPPRRIVKIKRLGK